MHAHGRHTYIYIHMDLCPFWLGELVKACTPNTVVLVLVVVDVVVVVVVVVDVVVVEEELEY